MALEDLGIEGNFIESVNILSGEALAVVQKNL
jgi:hypothetical protein